MKAARTARALSLLVLAAVATSFLADGHYVWSRTEEGGAVATYRLGFEAARGILVSPDGGVQVQERTYMRMIAEIRAFAAAVGGDADDAATGEGLRRHERLASAGLLHLVAVVAAAAAAVAAWWVRRHGLRFGLLALGGAVGCAGLGRFLLVARGFVEPIGEVAVQGPAAAAWAAVAAYAVAAAASLIAWRALRPRPGDGTGRVCSVPSPGA